jgi:hypothetical protein
MLSSPSDRLPSPRANAPCSLRAWQPTPRAHVARSSPPRSAKNCSTILHISAQSSPNERISSILQLAPSTRKPSPPPLAPQTTTSWSPSDGGPQATPLSGGGPGMGGPRHGNPITGGLPAWRRLRSTGRGADHRGDEALAPPLPLLSLFLASRSVGWRHGGGINFNQGRAWDVHGGSQQRGPWRPPWRRMCWSPGHVQGTDASVHCSLSVCDCLLSVGICM